MELIQGRSGNDSRVSEMDKLAVVLKRGIESRNPAWPRIELRVVKPPQGGREMIFLGQLEVKFGRHLIVVVVSGVLERSAARGGSRDQSARQVSFGHWIDTSRINDSLRRQGGIGLEKWIRLQE